MTFDFIIADDIIITVIVIFIIRTGCVGKKRFFPCSDVYFLLMMMMNIITIIIIIHNHNVHVVIVCMNIISIFSVFINIPMFKTMIFKDSLNPSVFVTTRTDLYSQKDDQWAGNSQMFCQR